MLNIKVCKEILKENGNSEKVLKPLAQIIGKGGLQNLILTRYIESKLSKRSLKENRNGQTELKPLAQIRRRVQKI